MTYNDAGYDINMIVSFSLLRQFLPELDVDHCSRRLREFGETIAEWNHYARLVSSGDLHKLKAHMVDSLSLVPVVAPLLDSDGLLLDIGSGAGFPAVVMKFALPEISMVLMERDARKAAFLKKVVGRFGFEGVDIVGGSFPGDVPEGDYRVVTARAVEKPGVVLPAIGEFLGSESAFICQSSEANSFLGEGFVVEEVDDEWDRSRLRRGVVRVFRRI